jgi:hypothetical protein
VAQERLNQIGLHEKAARVFRRDGAVRQFAFVAAIYVRPKRNLRPAKCHSILTLFPPLDFEMPIAVAGRAGDGDR